MKLEEIKQIVQTTNPIVVNQSLKEGYFLLKIISSKVRHGDVEEIKPCYILGNIDYKEQ